MGGAVEGRQLRSRIAHADVQPAELVSDLVEHPLDVLGARDVGLDHAPLGTTPAHLRQGLVRRVGLRVIVHGDVDAALRELERDAPPDPRELPVTSAR
jgi:hypothetical protein